MGFLKFLWNDPIKAMGFESKAHPGQVDHGKLWSTIIMVWVMWFITVMAPEKFSVGIVIVITSASFGRAMWGRFLESKAVTSREINKNVDIDIDKNSNVEKNIRQTVQVERDYDKGEQPWAGPNQEHYLLDGEDS